jgi:hypothetical protein
VEELPPPKPGESSWIIEFKSLTRYRRPVKKAECDVRTSTSRKPLKDWVILGFTFIRPEDADKVVEYIRNLADVEMRKREVGARPFGEVLEGVVARVLRDLGFSVQTNVRLRLGVMRLRLTCGASRVLVGHSLGSTSHVRTGIEMLIGMLWIRSSAGSYN